MKKYIIYDGRANSGFTFNASILCVAEINRGYFSECNGGYVRQFDKNQSIILTVRDEAHK